MDKTLISTTTNTIEARSNANEEVTSHYLELQNWIPTTRCSLISYQDTPFVVVAGDLTSSAKDTIVVFDKAKSKNVAFYVVH